MPNSTKPSPAIVESLSDAARSLDDAKQRRLEVIREARSQGLSNAAIAEPLGMTANGVRLIVQRAS